MPRQSVTRLSWPPSTGAITGARPEIKISREKKINRSRPEYRSRATARAMTKPAAPARPCSNRSPMRTPIVGANAQANEVSR